MNDRVTVEVELGELELLVDLAGVARNPRFNGGSIAPYVGGSARANAARKAHDAVKQRIRDNKDVGTDDKGYQNAPAEMYPDTDDE